MNKIDKITQLVDKNLLYKNEIILNKLYEQILKIYKNTKVNVENLEFSEIKSSNKLKSGFCSPIIQDYINKNLKFVYKITCFNSIILYHSKHKLSNIINDNEIIKRMGTICCIIGIMRKLFNNNNFLTLNYYETDFKKTFPKKGKILTELNCNSGSSYIGKYLIFIWRTEEYKRVLFHELIHAFKGDISLVFNDNINSLLSKFFCLNNDNYINVNETYTETLATIFNLIFYSIENKKNIMDCFIKEFSYSLLLCVSILKHFNYKSIKNLKQNKNCKLLPQKTSVFNYYIMKPFMLINLNSFFDMTEGNKKCIKNFKLEENCITVFFNLIIKNFNNNYLQELIDYLLKTNIKTNKLKMVLF